MRVNAKKITDNIKYLTWIYMFLATILMLFLFRMEVDFPFHMQRLSAIADELRMNGLSALPIRIYHTTLNNYGYGSPMFYGDIFMWPFALLVVCGVSVINAYKIMNIFILFATYFSANLSMKVVFDDKNASDTGVFIYVASTTIFGNVTGSILGRAFAGIFVPLAISGLYLILNKEKQYDWLYLALGMSGLVFSNVLDAVICAFTLAVILIFSIKNVNVRKISKIILAAIVCLGLTFWFIAPMLEQMHNGQFFVTNNTTNQKFNNLEKYTVPLVGLLLPFRMVNCLYHILGFNTENYLTHTYMYGITFMIAVVVIAIIYRKKLLYNTFNKIICILLLFYIIFQTKIFPHEALKAFIGVFQFPFRVQICMTMICGWLIAEMSVRLKEKRGMIFGIISLSALILVVSVVSSFGIDAVYSIIKHKPSYEFTSVDVGMGEYIPDKLLNIEDRGYFKKFIEERGERVICSNPNTEIDFTRNKNGMTIVYRNNKFGKFELPLLMYKGYCAMDVDSGNLVPVEISKNGLVEFESNKPNGEIEVWYEGTSIQKISEVISLLSIAALCAYLAVKKLKIKI